MNWNTNSSPSEELKQFEAAFKNALSSPKRVFTIAAIALVLIAGYSSFYEVQPDERAVVTRFGRYVSTQGPGLNFKLPFGIDRALKVSTRVEQEIFGFRQAVPQTQAVQGNFTANRAATGNPAEESLMLTGDLNVADVQWVVQYQVSDPRKWLFNVASQQRNIRDISMATMRRVVGDRSVFDVLTVGREQLALQARMLTQEILNKYDMGVEIRDFNLQRVTPPDPVQPSFNDVSSAIQNKNEMVTLANAEYDRLIPEAKGRAEREVLGAEGYATEIVNRAKGDANRLVQVIREYNKAPEVTKTRLYLELAQEMFGRFQSVTIVDPSLKGLLPVFEQSQSSSDAIAATQRAAAIEQAQLAPTRNQR